MKKKTFIIILAPVLITSYLYYSTQKESPKKTMKSLIQNTIEEVTPLRKKTLSKVLPKEVLQNKVIDAFVDSTLSQTDFLKDARVKSYKDAKVFLKTTYNTLNKCFKTGCEQAPSPRGFMDPSLSDAAYSLKTILDLANEHSQQLDSDQWISLNSITNILETDNEDLRDSAFKHLFNKLPIESSLSEIIKATSNLEGESMGHLYQKLKSFINDKNKDLIVQSLKEMSSNKDAYTIIESLNALEGQSFTQEHINIISLPLCERFFKDKILNSPNKGMLNALSSLHENNVIFEMERHCP